jgi:hypothetical protein
VLAVTVNVAGAATPEADTVSHGALVVAVKGSEPPPVLATLSVWGAGPAAPWVAAKDSDEGETESTGAATHVGAPSGVAAEAMSR